MTIADRFWTKVDRTDSCWLWRGARKHARHGLPYGRFGVQVAGRTRIVPAHRMAWELSRGVAPPEQMVVCHRCDNPPCVNPDHLFLATQADNMRDMAAKGRNRKGAEHWRARLSEGQVREIRAANDNGVAQTDLAREYGVHVQTIFGIVHRKRWRHVE